MKVRGRLDNTTVFLYSICIVNLLDLPLAPPSLRKIIHCDCDCFYASVEMRDDPSLRGRPLAVGGRPDHRGVIATCNYEARRFGVHSAMSSALALRKCPELLIMPPSMEKYRIASRQIMAIYRDYTAEVEPLSLDEAYLDVTRTDRCKGSATLMANEIRERVRDTVGVTVSAGVAPNKFVAKIASDWNKPDGLYVVRPHEVDAFVAALPVRKIFGVGKVTAAKLEKLGLTTCAQLRDWALVDLHRQFGVFGKRLYELSRGIDERPVRADQERKSVSVETTYVTDLRTLEECAAELRRLAEQLDVRIARADAAAAVRKLFVKIRFADFQRTTVECVGEVTHLPTLLALLEKGFARRNQPVRLLGVGVRLEEEHLAQNGQFTLFDDEPADEVISPNAF
ncbi:DNA polymerase IV [Paraburkholderia phenazinium]|jgi:DNA polymerase-4|uniref:DNA polymerase IV n=1 Tax=Paraburkholderia phenazinium TaxID=60549 RepID=A0A1G7YUR4_9BURK|nr:DNA polymerase IV [Paraburkholderia phenazinium]SDG99610.1 DNA polymerase-4 [Paraburkholderia phenazinium]